MWVKEGEEPKWPDYKVVEEASEDFFEQGKYSHKLIHERKTVYYFDSKEETFDFILMHIRCKDFFHQWFNDEKHFGFTVLDECGVVSFSIEKWEGFDEELEVALEDEDGNVVSNDLGETVKKYNGWWDDDRFTTLYCDGYKKYFTVSFFFKGRSIFEINDLRQKWNKENEELDKEEEPEENADNNPQTDCSDLPF